MPLDPRSPSINRLRQLLFKPTQILTPWTLVLKSNKRNSQPSFLPVPIFRCLLDQVRLPKAPVVTAYHLNYPRLVAYIQWRMKVVYRNSRPRLHIDATSSHAFRFSMWELPLEQRPWSTGPPTAFRTLALSDYQVRQLASLHWLYLQEHHHHWQQPHYHQQYLINSNQK